MPIAIPLSLTMMSPNLMRLLSITSSMASSRAFDKNPYVRDTSLFERYPERQARQMVVPMLGYMATASYVNRLALGGRVRFSRSDFNSAKFLKYKAWSFTMGCSVAST